MIKTLSKSKQWLVQSALLVYLILLFCPLRFCVPNLNVDHTWFFALNYAAAHGLVEGRDFFWTYGPLAYLLVPFDIANNLIWGLLTQATIWALFGLSLWALFFKSRLPLVNLSVFSFFLALTSLNFHQSLYPGNLLIWTAVILLVYHYLQPNNLRFISALVLLGLLPLFTFSGAVLAVPIVAGFFIERLLSSSETAKIQAIFVLLLPLFSALSSLYFILGSFSAIVGHIRASLELAGGYSFAMSAPISLNTVVLVGATVLLFLFVLLSLRRVNSAHFKFFLLVLLTPVLVELKHGLVRPDIWHLLQFFSMTAFVISLAALAVPFGSTQARDATIVVAMFVLTFWLVGAASGNLRDAFVVLSAVRTPHVIWRILHYHELRREIQSAGQKTIPVSARTEPEIAGLIADETVGFLSNAYSNAFVENLNLSLFPVVGRYSAYTPFLDALDAKWIATQGPRFLLFDGTGLDGRQPWAESPATWLEVYRWYNKRALGSRNLLLERRPQPRFRDLDQIEQRTANFGEYIYIPDSSNPIFWTMTCPLNVKGKFWSLLYRIPEVTMSIATTNGETANYRALIPVLAQPSLGNYLPSNLAQFGDVFDDPPKSDFSIKKLSFSGPGAAAYDQKCQFTLLHAVSERQP